MLKVLAEVGNNYGRATAEPFAGHPVASMIRDQLSAAISKGLRADHSGVIVMGSAGAGNWAEVPWVAVFDPRVTDSATKGYYVVFLFSANKRSVYLSLNQGTTAVVEEFKSAGYQVLKERADLIRKRLPEYVSAYPELSIDLGSTGRLPRGYEAGHAIGKSYSLDNLPSEEALTTDLQGLVDAYLKLTFRGGVDFSVEEESEDEASGGSEAGTLIERRRYRMHRKIERNPRASKAAKRYHGLACKACEMNFEARYGKLGRGYIEAHHLKPLASIEEGASAAYNVAEDFTVLCANCHRMIHRTAQPEDLAGFRRMIMR